MYSDAYCSKVKIVVMEPGIDAVVRVVVPTEKNLMRIIGGEFEQSFPRNNGICILHRKLEREQVVRANRAAVNHYTDNQEMFYGIIIAIGCDEITCKYRSLTKEEEVSVLGDYLKPHFPDYWWFGLEKGEELKFLDYRKDAIYDAPLDNGFDEMTVQKEYKYFIRMRAIYHHWDGDRTFDFCINKSDIIAGAKIKRMKTGELLGEDKYKLPMAS